MYYRLVLLNGAALPATLAVSTGQFSAEYAIHAGGILLAADEADDTLAPRGGSAALRLFRIVPEDRLEPCYMQTLAYSRDESGGLSFGHVGHNEGAGQIDGEMLHLRAALVAGIEEIELTFRAAPDEPISPSWSTALFSYGFSHAVVSTKSGKLLFTIPSRLGVLGHALSIWRKRRAAARRISRAWRTP